jgi:two-component system nitrogen regulation response regulator NtrX
VDDEAGIRELICEFIEMHYDVAIDIALDGQEAYKICKDRQYNLIISDHKMPNMTGAQFIQKIRAEETINANTPVIYITGYLADLKDELQLSDNLLFLEKPLSMQRLIGLANPFLGSQKI